MQPDSENFSNNLELLRSHLKLSQTDLAKLIGVPKTTVNKWFITGAIPVDKDNQLDVICDRIKSKHPKMDRISPDLLTGNPYKFAVTMGMPRYKVGPTVNKLRLPVKNIALEPGDTELQNITGFYRIFYPSVAYEGAFFGAALKIIADGEDGLFYFESFNYQSDSANQNRSLPSLYQSGLVGRFGEAETSNAVLLTGDLVGEHGEHAHIGQRFTSLKIPRESRPKRLLGKAMAVNFNKKSASYGYLLESPAVALAIDDVPRDCDVKEYAPKKPYLDLDEMRSKYPDAISALKQMPVPWCYRIDLDQISEMRAVR